MSLPTNFLEAFEEIKNCLHKGHLHDTVYLDFLQLLTQTFTWGL